MLIALITSYKNSHTSNNYYLIGGQTSKVQKMSYELNFCPNFLLTPSTRFPNFLGNLCPLLEGGLEDSDTGWRLLVGGISTEI